MLVGLVFFLCLMAVACLIALAWGARALWARLTGQPIVPMSMGAMSPFAGWQTVYRSGAEWMAQSSGNAQTKDDTREARPRRGVLPGAGDVTDVQPREVHES